MTSKNNFEINNINSTTPPNGALMEQITYVKHYTDRLFSFRTSRSSSLRFRAGEFVMIGLPGDQKPIFRAYSITSPTWDEELEFYSIKVPDGPLTSRLQKIKVGDKIFIRKKASGTVVLSTLIPGENLYLLSTGTGIAPFASLIREPETYENYQSVVLTHTCRLKAELEYGYDIAEATYTDPLVGSEAKNKLKHIATTTREESSIVGRITKLITSKRLFDILDSHPLDPKIDRVMVCGSMDFLRDSKGILDEMGFKEGSHREPGTYVVERAFVD